MQKNQPKLKCFICAQKKTDVYKLGEILSSKFPEFKDKQLCTDCRRELLLESLTENN